MALWVIPLDQALPALQARLARLSNESLDPGEALVFAGVLEPCIKTCEALVAFALLVGGKPSRQ